jgi:hypothetical protein
MRDLDKRRASITLRSDILRHPRVVDFLR